MLINNSRDFDFLEIGLAAPDRIRFWSYGEIEKPETINYRTFKPERKGLFCEKIFGPVKDWECSCGKYRRVRYRGVVCERCGVEVTHSKVRRERMGHIELATPVTHIWFLKGIPSYIGLLLDMSSRYLEEIVYYDSYVVTEVSPELEDILPIKKLLSTVEYVDLKEKYKDKFKADIGASAIKSLLAQMDIKKLITESYQLLDELKGQKRLKVTKRLRVLEGLFKSGNRPEWMILDVIPVMPPDLRPMVQLEGGRFATSDLNDLYRRIVNRNNRLKRLMDINAPEMIIRNEKRMLQEAVDVLISNGKRGRAVTGSNGRPLKSLGNIIEGKQGRFRQNLLGKRVDYSARSVIVVGPHLKFYQCGLPKEMALELFKPFVIRKLVEEGIVSNVKSAKKKIEKKEIAVWDALEKVIKGQCVLLNRAPTLHRLGIQAFEPILVEGSAIQIHPLVCTAFNADFDGDQMAVHVPLGFEAQTEARLLIMSSNNILSPSSGRPIVTPTQDMTLGCYFLTIDNPDSEHGKGKTYKDIYDAIISWENKAVGIQSEIIVKVQNQKIKTTIGRILFNKEIWDVLKSFELPESLYINHKVGKSELADMVYRWYITYGNDVTSELIDRLKNIGFKYSTLSGISISIDDLTIPKNKASLLEHAQKEIEKLEKLEKSGAIGSNEKRLRSNDVWRGTTQQVSDALEKEMGRLNNIYIMAHSGARGNIDQVRQLAGMRGLMSDSQGRTVDIPIRSNFKEGLNVTEYFISTYGARKGLVDTALRTADSGYLTRRLVDVAQDVIITADDCGTKEGIELTSIRDGINIVVPFHEMIEGRVSLEMVKHPKTSEVIIEENECISRDHAKLISQAGIESLKVRSVYHCKVERGICQKCYGIDLASAKLINIGEAVGIIAAQSIGEPGTQLTMRTFHTGGVDLRKAAKVDIKANISGKVSIPTDALFTKINMNSSSVWISTQDNYISILGDTMQYQLLPKGTSLLVKQGQDVNVGTILAEYDPSFEYIVAQESGTLKLLNAELQESKDEKGNITHVYSQKDGEIFVYNPSNIKEIEVSSSILEKCKINSLASAKLINNPDIVSSVLILDIGKKQEEKVKKKSLSTVNLKVVSGEVYSFLRGAQIYVVDGDKLNKGDIIARERIDDLLANKTQDIVQGLPRVEELFEARKIKDSAVLSEIDGIIDVEQSEYYRLLYVTSKDGFQKEYKIPLDSRLKVFSGQSIKKGDQLNEGGINPHDVLETIGVVETQRFLSEEIQKVYRSQGVQINSKHIEVIVRQMTRKVIIMDMGDTTFLLNELVDIRVLNKINEDIIKQGKKPAIGKYVLLGITRASLNTESFVSASSFQQTASVLTQAAVTGKVDQMRGLKESVIIGKRIPAGTGFTKYDHLKLILSDEPEVSNQELDKKIILNK